MEKLVEENKEKVIIQSDTLPVIRTFYAGVDARRLGYWKRDAPPIKMSAMN